jgi:DNA-binding SARP family transcriptional activator
MRQDHSAEAPIPRASIVQRKLAIPPAPSQLLERPRVTELVIELLNRHRLLRVCATAGAGKTTAVVQAVQSGGRPAAWLSVDHTDSAPGRLVTYLEAAIATAYPDVLGTATGALSAGLAHAEAAGLLAEAIGDRPLVLVLDDLERLGDSRVSWRVIAALARYAPHSVRLILISRRDILQPFDTTPEDDAFGGLGEEDLALTTSEAAAALKVRGADTVDPIQAVEATGGWVTGVLFEAWRSAAHVIGSGGEADPLNGYLSSQILGDLPEDERGFLITTSLLDEVTASRAEALGLEQSAERIHRLRAAHIPATWFDGGMGMRCHPRFREYLRERLRRRPGTALESLHRRHAQLLESEGQLEEATEGYLTIGAYEDALRSAEQAIFAVIERLDFAIAERWVGILSRDRVEPSDALEIASLMLAVAQDDYRRSVALADRLRDAGRRDELAAGSGRAAALMAWSYLHAARAEDTEAILSVAAESPEVDVVREATAFMYVRAKGGTRAPGGPISGPLAALGTSRSYFFGRLQEVLEPSGSVLADMLSRPFRIGALRAMGRTHEALELYQAAMAAGPGSLVLNTTIGPELLIDSGRLDEARTSVQRGRELALASGSVGLQAVNAVAAMKLELRVERDPAAARAVLDRLEREPALQLYPHTIEQSDMWYGLALLLEGDNVGALARLRRAVAAMVAGDRILELPTAGVYLAEAEWRGGDEDAADSAARLALDAAHRQGSNHLLLQALSDFPAVATRQMDAQSDPDTEWHGLGRALLLGWAKLESTIAPRVRLADFGVPTLWVDGTEVRPGLAKSYELLAYLALHRGARVSREALLQAMFNGRSDKSTRAYVRQAIQRLRTSLPESSSIEVERGEVCLHRNARVSLDSERFEAGLAEAARLQGSERLVRTLDALELYVAGPYLAETDSEWAGERRRQLERLAAGARFEAAKIALGIGQINKARRLTEETLRDDPYREEAWRLAMRVAGTLGDNAGVVDAFQGCQRALSELATSPSPSTQALFEHLRG